VGETPNPERPSQLAKGPFHKPLAPPILGIGLSLAVTRVSRLLPSGFPNDKLQALKFSALLLEGEAGRLELTRI
jgi:hypothetical protein